MRDGAEKQRNDDQGSEEGSRARWRDDILMAAGPNSLRTVYVQFKSKRLGNRG